MLKLVAKEELSLLENETTTLMHNSRHKHFISTGTKHYLISIYKVSKSYPKLDILSIRCNCLDSDTIR